MIQPFVNLDKHAAKREDKQYTVRSIYWDTPRMDFYDEKIEGVPNRKKLRLRGYDTPEISKERVFTEIKRKYQIPILKNRCLMQYEDACALFKGHKTIEEVVGPDREDERLNANRFFYYMGKMQLVPVVLVTYEREPFLSKTDDTIRVTLDKNLRSMAFPTLDDLYENEKLKLAMPDRFILEVKFNEYYPGWMKAIAHTLNLKQVTASKYCICIDNHGIADRIQKFKVISNAKLFREKRA